MLDSEIIPDNYQNELMRWRDMFRAGYFDIGDIANVVVYHAQQSHFKVTMEEVYAACGRFCGKSGRTVRYYADIAAYFPPDVRSEFEALPFSHFVFARSTGAKWREVLEYAASSPYVSEDELSRRFQKTPDVRDNSSPDVRSDISPDVRADSSPDVSAKMPSAYYRGAVGWEISQLVNHSRRMRQVAGQVTLQANDYKRLQTALDMLDDAIEELQRAIPSFLEAQLINV